MSNYKLEDDKINLKPMITLFKSHQSLTKFIKDDIRKYEFDLNEFGVLEVLYHHPRLRVSHVNEKVLVNSSSLTYILDKLEKKLLIKREVDKDDKRVIYIKLTNEGKKVGDKIFPPHYKQLNQIFGCLTGEEKDELSRLLKKVGLKAKEFGE